MLAPNFEFPAPVSANSVLKVNKTMTFCPVIIIKPVIEYKKNNFHTEDMSSFTIRQVDDWTVSQALDTIGNYSK